MRTLGWLLLSLWIGALGAGCALVGAGRASIGVTATTQGTIGLAVAGELAGGVAMLPDASAPWRGLAGVAGPYAGAGATSDGWELEAGERAELAWLGDARELRAGVRVGALARELRGPALAIELALAAADSGWWETAAGRSRLGVELRAGPLFARPPGGADAMADGGAASLALGGWRGFVGVTYQATAIGRRHNPFAHLLDDVGKR